VAFVERLCDITGAPRRRASSCTRTNAHAGLAGSLFGPQRVRRRCGSAVRGRARPRGVRRVVVHELRTAVNALGCGRCGSFRASPSGWLASCTNATPGTRSWSGRRPPTCPPCWSRSIGPFAARIVLRGLMTAAWAVSARLSRRMEMHADRLSALVVGSEKTVLALGRHGESPLPFTTPMRSSRDWLRWAAPRRCRRLRGSDLPKTAPADWIGRADTGQSHRIDSTRIRLMHEAARRARAGRGWDIPGIREAKTCSGVHGNLPRPHAAALRGDARPGWATPGSSRQRVHRRPRLGHACTEVVTRFFGEGA